ncbi:2OG-Fe(II) oxygenase superfamily protein [Phytophthora infestans T30-4]|uniref:2OG-Fe(II) oxygenase superfamily protein n=2 Tax=Phytophthora infestans TaxID=4787 RepID=D0MRW3_PHYIT|nr:2OG-Fe(II) oxygenase superfamily protein [Phytophthora infestans T30-4]EEY58232.1 2OG-Fe(II) oxygenase superfamily protein [Phytophthora infestans T30-4]KAF4149941.1 2OG-Fe(II) oxygenase superfamily [Phytophthora infestans]|eukprot:XP_002909418.1 2OG-Fe(II) oxygenase superfamily protein [Phytophthora infestans T30-4]
MNVHQVPVIDIGALMEFSSDVDVDAALRNPNSDSLRQIIEQIRKAASEWGFFYITNHGLPEKEVEHFQETMRSFFRLPVETKRNISRSAANARGYVEGELTKNKTDCKECFDFAGAHEDAPPNNKNDRLGEEQNQWLEEETLPGFRNEMQTYYNKMDFISRRLLKIFAVALGEEPAFFDQFFHGINSSLMRLNHYPVAPEPEKTMGVYHHTDSGALTILLQEDDVASLQVLHRESQTWVNVPPRKGTYTINIGDLVQVWSNDRFVAPLHRVLASNKAGRFSAPFFYLPAYDVEVEPIVVKQEEVPNYLPFSWRQFLLGRVQGNYADLGKENQIGDFKIHGPVDVANT